MIPQGAEASAEPLFVTPAGWRRGLEALPAPTLRLTLERALSAAEPALLAHAAEALLEESGRRGDHELRGHLVARLLDLALGPLPALHAPLRPLAPAVLEVLLQYARGSDSSLPLHDALADRMRLIDQINLPPEIVARVARFRREEVSGQPSLVNRMRSGQRLADVFRTLTGAAPAPALRETLLSLADLKLNQEHLPVVLAHAVPLLRRGDYGEEIGLLAVENLERFGAQLATFRADWVAAERARRRLPDTTLAPVEEQTDHLYAVFVHQELSRAVEALREPTAPALPGLLGLEVAWHELGNLLAPGALAVWGDSERVQIALFRLLESMPSLRLRAVSVFGVALSEGQRTEAVQLAAIDFAARFLSGLGAEEARLRQSTVVIRRDDGRYERLGAEVEAVLACNHELRLRLEQAAFDSRRPHAVRRRSLGALLQAGASDAEQRRLVLDACRGDTPVVEALLDHVIATRAHTAFRDLSSLYERRDTLPAPLRQRLYEAISFTAHLDAPGLLRQDILAGSPDAEQALSRSGALFALEQLTAEREIRLTLGKMRGLNDAREAELRNSAHHLADSLRHDATATAASVEATRLGSEGQAEAASYLVADAGTNVRFVPWLRRLRELLAQVPELNRELAALRSRIEELQGQVERARSQIDDAIAQIRVQERSAQDATNELRRLQERGASLQRDVDQAEQRVRGLSRELAQHQNEITQTPEGAHGARQRADVAQRQINQTNNRLEELKAQLSSLPRLVRAQQDALDGANRTVVRLERQVQETKSSFARYQEQERHAQRASRNLQEELDRIRREIETIKHEISQIRREGQQLAAHHQQQLAAIHQDQREALEQMQSEQRAASAALSQAQLARERALRLAADIEALEQRCKNLAQGMANNRQATAEQLGELDALAKRTEQQRKELTRLRQEVDLSIDVLLCSLCCLREPGRELARLRKVLEGS